MITDHAEGTFGSLRYVLGGDHPSQTTRLALFPARVRQPLEKGWYFKDGSTMTGATASKPPTYPTHPLAVVNTKL